MAGMRGEGSVLCEGTTNANTPCGNPEIEGLEYCLHHMPDDLLDEAEAVTGYKRCRFGSGCRVYATEGTDPPRCKDHGANTGSASSKNAALRVINGGAADRAAEILAEYGDDLLSAQPVNDPYGELMQLAGEMRAWKNRLTQFVTEMRITQYRYQGKTGEQLRAEIVLYERAIERYGTLLVQIARLNLDARLVGIRQQTMEMMDRALDLALEDSGVPLDKKAAARATFRRHLKIVA